MRGKVIYRGSGEQTRHLGPVFFHGSPNCLLFTGGIEFFGQAAMHLNEQGVDARRINGSVEIRYSGEIINDPRSGVIFGTLGACSRDFSCLRRVAA